jgi:hypothetical protein
MMPHNLLKAGTDLSKAPYVLIVLIRQFKGETGTRQHMLALASSTRSGIALCWWIEELIKIREEESCTHGPAFGDSNGAVAFLFKYDGILHHFLGIVQQEHPDLIAENDDVRINYSFFRLFRKTTEGQARAAGLDSSVQNAMNRWKTIENAKGAHPCFNMIEH